VAVKNKTLKLEWLILMMFTLFSIPTFAQWIGPQAPSHPSEESVQNSRKPIQVDVSLVLVNVTVTDPYDRCVTGLEKENFRVFEDGTQQEIVNFSSEDVPISIGVIFDMSGSMSDKLEKARQAAVQFLRAANPRDEFFLVSFNDYARLTSEFTSSVEELQNRMVSTSG
jgi:Ca-activated chloride channel homolog